MSLNKVMLLGNLGRDPELRYTASNVPVCSFSLATSEVWIDKGGAKHEKTEWHNIVVWKKAAENCSKYLKKGSKVLVEGKLTTSTWEHKVTGVKNYKTEIVASKVEFLSSPRASAEGSQPGQNGVTFGQDQERGAAGTWHGSDGVGDDGFIEGSYDMDNTPINLEDFPF